MTYTIWSSAGKFEWIIWHANGDNIFLRSGLIHTNYSAAKRAMLKALRNV